MSDPFLSEIKIISWNFPPKGWAFCNGQLLPINQNQALFSLLGTTYGGDGRVNFALPNLQARIPAGAGSSITLGQLGGETAHTVSIAEMAAHNHLLRGDNTTPAANNTDSPAPAGTKVLGQSAGSGGSPPAPYGVQMYSTASPNAAMASASIAAFWRKSGA